MANDSNNNTPDMNKNNSSGGFNQGINNINKGSKKAFIKNTSENKPNSIEQSEIPEKIKELIDFNQKEIIPNNKPPKKLVSSKDVKVASEKLVNEFNKTSKPKQNKIQPKDNVLANNKKKTSIPSEKAAKKTMAPKKSLSAKSAAPENNSINKASKKAAEKKTNLNKNAVRQSNKSAKNKVLTDTSKTMVIPKAETGKIDMRKIDTGKKRSFKDRLFSEKFFVYENKPRNFLLSVAVSTMRMFIVFMFIGVISAIGALFGVASAYVETSPLVNSATLTDLSKTSLIYDANGNEIAKYTGVENRVWVKLENMPKNLTNAFVSIEDTRFYSHEGIDYKRLFGAFVGNLQSSTVQGGSTISQQLVKIRMLTSERSYKRKIQEAYMTMVLEKSYSKDQILESYMNTILLGGSNYGVEAAANDYFNKDVSQLTLRECAMLAGITQSPNKYNPRTNYFVKNTPEVIDDRTNLVLQSMYSAGRITHEELTAALAEKVDVKQTSSFKSDKLQYAYFVEYAIEDIINNLIIQRGLEDNKENRNKIENELRTNGYKIYLTIDTNIQNAVQTTLSEWTGYPRMRKASAAYVTETIGNDTVKHAQPEAAAVVYDYHNGEYKAIVGGRNLPTAEKISNRAYVTEHGVGSSIKPVTIYGPALDMGLSPNSTLSNEKKRIPGWNTASGYPAGGGPSSSVSMRSAIIGSYNRAAAHTLMTKVGVETAAQYLLNMGVDEDHINNNLTGAGLGLGAAPITPVEMSVCFGTIANSGEYIKPISFSKVVDGDGKVILDGKALQEQNRKQVYKASSAFMLTDMLMDAVSSGTGRSAKISGMNTAGKTGTNQDKSVSFSGYTPYYSASIYIGHDKNESLGNVFAGSYAAPLWRAFMTKIHEGLENKPIIEGSIDQYDLNRVRICSVTGMKATSACSLDVQGNTPTTTMVSQDSIPSASCNAHHRITICADSHRIATDNCPSTSKVDIAMLRVSEKVSTSMANSYLNALKNKYPNFNSGSSCNVHTASSSDSNETTTTKEPSTTTKEPSSSTNQSLSSIKTEAANLLSRVKKIIDNPGSKYTQDQLAKLKNAYNNLNSYYKRSDASEAGIRQRINNLNKYL